MSDGKILTREDFLSGNHLKKELVAVPDLGGAVWMRQFSAAQVISFNDEIKALRSKGIKETDAATDLELMSLAISFSACDADGKLLFTEPDDVKNLLNNKLDVISLLGLKALEVSEISTKQGELSTEVADDLKNGLRKSSLVNSRKNSRKRAKKS